MTGHRSYSGVNRPAYRRVDQVDRQGYRYQSTVTGAFVTERKGFLARMLGR